MRALFGIFKEVLEPGDIFPYPLDTTFLKFSEIWLAEKSFSYVGLLDGVICGAYYVKPQWPGRGSHVATATYMVGTAARGKGIGLALAEHSIDAARGRGYRAMQFNLVISTNKAAVKLWQKIGFQIIGTVPGGFEHAELGFVDTYLMYRFL
ncbi:MAG: GNAT family N-acetyltransferase [Cyanobacteria bacterium REEB67]|nr:GNAT family N-acetyltransferase [Cyanobacteria bacterium REEB67]